MRKTSRRLLSQCFTRSELLRHSQAVKQKKTGNKIPMVKLQESSDVHPSNGEGVTFSVTRSPDSNSTNPVAPEAGDAGRSDKASLFKAIARCFGPFFLVGCFLKLMHDILLFVSPQLLK